MKPKTLDAIRAHAVAEFPRESCGLVIVARGREMYLPCRNAAVGSEHFILPAEDFVAAEGDGEVVCVVHSHPLATARPSHADLTSCEASGLRWAIVAVAPADVGGIVAGEVYEFEPSGYEPGLIGVEFSHGVNDCYSLVRRWFSQERSIDLPDFVRRDDWWLDGKSNLYLDHYREAGFSPIPEGAPLKAGDVIIMQVRSPEHPNHAGVYIDEGFQWMLHHMHGRLSTRVVYGGYWRDVTRVVVRHKDLA